LCRQREKRTYASAAVTSAFYSVLVHNRTSLSHHSDDQQTKHLKRCLFYIYIYLLYNRNCVHTLICFINNSTSFCRTLALNISPSFLASRRFYHHQTFFFEAENQPTHIPYTCVNMQIYYVSGNTTHTPQRLTIDPVITSCYGKAPRTALDVSSSEYPCHIVTHFDNINKIQHKKNRKNTIYLSISIRCKSLESV